MSRVVCALSIAMTTLIAANGQEVPPYRDPVLPIEPRLDDAMSRLSLAEKAAVLNHRGCTAKSLDLRSGQWNQCVNGVMWDRPATLFPACIAMAATWNTDLLHRVATALSDEVAQLHLVPLRADTPRSRRVLGFSTDPPPAGRLEAGDL